MVAVALLVALDLFSKSWVWTWMSEELAAGRLDHVACAHGGTHPRHLLAGNWLALMLNRNPGAAFGMFDGVPHLLVGGRGMAVLLLAWLIWRAPREQPAYLSSLVLILSGALGNLYDNLARPLPPMVEGSPYGPVRDFIDVYFYIPALGLDRHFPTFNVADSCITVGAILLLLSGLMSDLRERREERQARGAEPAQ